MNPLIEVLWEEYELGNRMSRMRYYQTRDTIDQRYGTVQYESVIADLESMHVHEHSVAEERAQADTAPHFRRPSL
jgi:hypothetical protein